jgi:hypothetical protein
VPSAGLGNLAFPTRPLAEGAAAALLQPKLKTWMPACAGMTERLGAGMTAMCRNQAFAIPR